jgi:hypothetical protein
MAAALLAVVAVTAAWDTPLPARSSPVILLYVGAADCAPCRVWQNGDAVRFRESAEFARVTYREVKSPTLRDALSDEMWPGDLRRYRDRLGRNAGVPLWLVVGDGEILAQGFGASQWRSVMLPSIRAFTR